MQKQVLGKMCMLWSYRYLEICFWNASPQIIKVRRRKSDNMDLLSRQPLLMWEQLARKGTLCGDKKVPYSWAPTLNSHLCLGDTKTTRLEQLVTLHDVCSLSSGVPDYWIPFSFLSHPQISPLFKKKKKGKKGGKERKGKRMGKKRKRKEKKENRTNRSVHTKNSLSVLRVCVSLSLVRKVFLN